jgi:membrane protein YdbS with pleckstrin-like domain
MSVRSRTRARTSTIIVLIWLLIGLFAAFQRGYLSSSEPNCTRLSSTAVTVIAGPLNYLGINPKIKCSTPQPS